MQTDFHTPIVAVLAGLDLSRNPLMGQPFRLNGIAAIMFETRLQARLCRDLWGVNRRRAEKARLYSDGTINDG